METDAARDTDRDKDLKANTFPFPHVSMILWLSLLFFLYEGRIDKATEKEWAA